MAWRENCAIFMKKPTFSVRMTDKRPDPLVTTASRPGLLAPLPPILQCYYNAKVSSVSFVSFFFRSSRSYFIFLANVFGIDLFIIQRTRERARRNIRPFRFTYTAPDRGVSRLPAAT